MHTPVQALVVVDQPALTDAIGRALTPGVCLIRVARNAAQALAAQRDWRPHVAVVDVDLGGGTILDRLGYVEPRPDLLPVLGLTRSGDIGTRLRAFSRGVDDVLTVPFFREELAARIRVIVRRTYRDTTVFAPALRVAGIEIDPANRRVRAEGKPLHLTARERELLYLLAANAGRVLSRDEILDHLWGAEYVAESNVVDRHIYTLRARLRNGSRLHPRIVTVPRRGYTLLVPGARVQP
jgi:DNA-binding response OmpR family regulator